MHALDFIMYIVLAVLLWLAIDKLTDGEYTHELGTLGGILIEIVFTIVYIILFAFYPDWNWVDIGINLPDIKW
jgi:hypothetical protein